MKPEAWPLPEIDWAQQAQGVRRLARALVYDPDRAEDVAQEALRIAWERGPRAGPSLRGWLAGILRNVARNTVRGDRHRREREAVASPRGPEVSPDERVERVAEQRRVLDAVLGLDEPYRACVILRYLEDRPPHEIARVLAVPLETVRTRLRRGLSRLRDLLAVDPVRTGRRGPALLPLATGGGSAGIEHGLGTLGVIAMKKTLVAAGLLGLVALGVWGITALRWIDREVPRPAPEESVARLAPTEERTSPLLRGDGGPKEGPATPPPVDLSSVDRERDVHGFVVDRQGAPISGARVLALTRSWRQGSKDGERSRRLEIVHGETVSSTDGSFAIRLERGASVNLRAEASGYGTVETTFQAAGGLTRVVLGPPARLSVVVRDERGGPVAEATLRFFQAGSFMVNAPRVSYAFSREGTSDAEGRCAFEGLPGDVWGYLDVEHPRWGRPGWIRVVLPASGERTEEVVLPEGRRITGRVTDRSTGLAIPGAFVGSSWMRDRAVATDAAGRYEFTGWTGKGTDELAAGAEGYVLVRLPVGSRDTIDFALEPGRTARGRVVDREGRPVEDAWVSAQSDEDPYGATVAGATTAADGAFELRRLRRDARYRFAATKEGQARGSREAVPPEDPTAVLEVGDITLRPGYRVEGRALDDEGQPAAGLEVRLTGHGEWRVTDDLGRFRFRDVAVGTYTLIVSGAGRESVRREVRAYETDMTGLEIRVTSGFPLEVLVEAADEPLPSMGCAIDVLGADGVLRRGYANDAGRVVVLVPEGEARVQIGMTPTGWLAPPPQIARTGQAPIRLVLRRAATIRGVVRGPDGQPMAGAVLRVRSPGRTDGLVSTDAEGRFHADVEPGSTADLTFEQLGGNPAPSVPSTAAYGEVRGVPAGRADVVLRVLPVAADRTLDVRVVGPDGSPVDGVAVSWGKHTAKTDTQGRVHLLGLPARPDDLIARSQQPGWLPGREADVLPEGQEVLLAFREGVVLTGHVQGARGPVNGAGLQAMHGSESVAWGHTGPDGAFTVSVDPARHFPLTLRAQIPGDRFREVWLDFDHPPSAPIEIRAP